MKKSVFLLTIFFHQMVFSQSTTVVISQIYGGGGTTTGTTAVYLYDYIELHNISSVAQNISSWSIQYGSATGNFKGVCVFPDNTIIAAGRYLLIQVGNAGKVGSPLPVDPDFITTSFTLAAGSGKIALTNQNQTSRLSCGSTTSPCTFPIKNVIDLVAYGAANNAEGNAAVNNGVAMTNAEGSVRKSNGCLDTDNNNNDFDVVSAPVPRNSLSSAVILPLILSKFKASVTNQIVSLSWSTVNESNIQEFIIEKSLDGNIYNCIGNMIVNHGNGYTSNYLYTDALSGGISYYRLKLIDEDGLVQYSSILPVSGSLTSQLKVFPNPAHSFIVVSYPKATHVATIDVITLNGNKVFSTAVEMGAVQTSISISHLVRGIYVILYKSESRTQTEKLIKD